MFYKVAKATDLFNYHKTYNISQYIDLTYLVQSLHSQWVIFNDHFVIGTHCKVLRLVSYEMKHQICLILRKKLKSYN